MEKIFKNKMESLSTEQIVEFVRNTWNEKVGQIIRDFAFEIIEEREGDEECDRIYSMIWNECNA